VQKGDIKTIQKICLEELTSRGSWLVVVWYQLTKERVQVWHQLAGEAMKYWRIIHQSHDIDWAKVRLEDYQGQMVTIKLEPGTPRRLLKFVAQHRSISDFFSKNPEGEEWISRA